MAVRWRVHCVCYLRSEAGWCTLSAVRFGHFATLQKGMLRHSAWFLLTLATKKSIPVGVRCLLFTAAAPSCVMLCCCAGEMEFDCAHWSVFENAMDMAHIHYLHDGSFGNQDKPVINDMDVTRDTWGIAAKFKWVELVSGEVLKCFAGLERRGLVLGMPCRTPSWRRCIAQRCPSRGLLLLVGQGCCTAC